MLGLEIELAFTSEIETESRRWGLGGGGGGEVSSRQVQGEVVGRRTGVRSTLLQRGDDCCGGAPATENDASAICQSPS